MIRASMMTRLGPFARPGSGRDWVLAWIGAAAARAATGVVRGRPGSCERRPDPKGVREGIQPIRHKALTRCLALRHMDRWGLLKAVDPGLTLPSDAVLPLRRFGKAVSDPPWSSKRLRSWVVGLSIWLADVPAGVRQRSLRRLAVRGEATEQVTGFFTVSQPEAVCPRQGSGARGGGRIAGG